MVRRAGSFYRHVPRQDGRRKKDRRSYALATSAIPSQFDAAGMQKYELARTNSFSYSAFNLEALTELANIVVPTGIDLYATKPGILTGIDALLPFDATHKWPHDQISAGKEDSLCPALIRGAAHTHDAKYLRRPRSASACKQTAVTLLEKGKRGS